MSEEKRQYQPVFPDIEDWPIHKLSEDRRSFVKEIDEFMLQRLLKQSPTQLTDLIAKTIFLERIRIKEEAWKVDPPNERQFWRRIGKKLVRSSLDRNDKEASINNKEILREIIHRYSEEIVGTFRVGTFRFARRFLTFFFTRLLNTAAGKNITRFWGSRFRLQDRFIVKGEIETVRSLMKKGTVVVVPTHFSNLDSILIGYALDAFAGLPSFSYGAGLNLYNTGYTAYFMNRLGAYRVDRRKKNPIYLETLKTMSNLSIQRGVNTLFFPGGTRSRDGMLEDKLKLGLLGSVIEAQRALCQKGGGKVFVVPLILSYHFVLEADFLIEQHLRQVGKERYMGRDASHSPWRIFQFVWKFFAEGNDVTISIGQPMDVLGNPVDADGNSFDQYGNCIDIEAYFKTKGEIREDLQRESEYTKILGDHIVERYRKDNIVLTSHLLAFAAFEMLKYQNPRLDLYGLLRLPTDDYVFSKEPLHEVISQLREALLQMEHRGEIKLSEQIHWEVEKLIEDGMAHLGNYHLTEPLYQDKKGQILSDNFKLLYFYHNRLENYGLQRKIKWKQLALQEVE
ncbi:MAG: 1-acyl-sn-glycerol-3-phosphate acyltransferase [Saprospiraceae bacterium]|nr:1-acyl-sn-glycerol-3-phosphate acyltransferase [Saprospiraceae bacterium]MDZ4704170.1 1-acyl-sn-glycerol-3-phosphate acyltransferase [Saprospiraceae bacterium]